MSDSSQDDNRRELPPSLRRAHQLIEELAAKGEETNSVPGNEEAKAFLDSIWQGKAVSRIPGQPKTDDNQRKTETG